MAAAVIGWEALGRGIGWRHVKMVGRETYGHESEWEQVKVVEWVVESCGYHVCIHMMGSYASWKNQHPEVLGGESLPISEHPVPCSPEA